MRTKAIDAILSVARLIERILEVRLPMAAASGLGIRFEHDENVETCFSSRHEGRRISR
jgi:hypothetical protein